MKKYIVPLAKDERETLGALTSKGKHKSQKILNALILLGCDEGEYQVKRSTNEVMSSALNISMVYPYRWRNWASPEGDKRLELQM
jgi:hypothetical protein